jgi:predicted nucleic acid-binding protein
MGWLLDTNVLSELRKGDRAEPTLRSWFARAADRDLYTSVLVLGEVRQGISKLGRRDPVAAQPLERWIRGLEQAFADRILPISQAVADRWGRLPSDQPVAAIDGLLAATAIEHGLTLVTRNVVDVARTGVPYFNPFSDRGR